MTVLPPMFFATPWLDRAARSRRDRPWLDDRLSRAATRFVPYWRDRPLLLEQEDTLAVWTMAPAALKEDRLDDAILLGIADDIAYFAIGFDGETSPPLPAIEGLAFHELRAAAARLDGGEAGMLAHGKAMLHWHARHRFCGVCGEATRSVDAGHVRHCTACETHHFPRTDAAVIMLIADGDRLLLGRQPSWPAGMYSVLAGFVEPGERLEDAVAREVMEEAGIEIANCRYFGSQPWPFPTSLMLGFRADAKTTEIKLDATELEDARWVSRAWLRANPDDPDLRTPPSGAIASHMIHAWLNEG